MKTNLPSDFDFLGVDVASTELVICCHPKTQVQTISNDKKSIQTWLKTLSSKRTALAVEATGCYHQTLIQLAHNEGIVCFLLNPKDIKYYVKASGARAKTDPVDAHLIARYCAKEHMELHVWQPSPVACERVLDSLKRRAKLVEVREMLTQSFHGLKALSKDLARVRASIDRVLAKIDVIIKDATIALPNGAVESKRLLAISGVGLLTSSYLLSLFTRIPFANSDAVVAFAGMDPRANDSGTKTGRRKLSKRGPAELRRLLFNAAMSGVRTRTWNPTYLKVRAAGKTSTEALLIVARKILRVAFSLFKTKSTFDANKILNAHV
jgi:transposase